MEKKEDLEYLGSIVHALIHLGFTAELSATINHRHDELGGKVVDLYVEDPTGLCVLKETKIKSSFDTAAAEVIPRAQKVLKNALEATKNQVEELSTAVKDVENNFVELTCDF